MATKPNTTWYGASSYNYTNGNRPVSDPINKVIIHVMQGSFSSAINWFKDPAAQASCHYNVRSSDGFIGQSVAEADIAWHAGNWDYNRTSVGIEHEGYVSNPDWFTDAMYRSSARLTAYLCEKYRIPIDRAHIIEHDEVPNQSHTDPGPYWNWTKYMDLVRSYAGGGAVYTQIVDNATAGRFRASSRWVVSSFHSGTDYGSNYRVLQQPLSVVDNAEFKIMTPARDSYDVYARWPADPGYNDRTTFLIRTSSGWVKRVVSQKVNGGKWVKLGRFTLDAGDSYRVAVSSRSARSGFIVADAVRIVRV